MDGDGGARGVLPPEGGSAGAQGLRAWRGWRERCTQAWTTSI